MEPDPRAAFETALRGHLDVYLRARARARFRGGSAAQAGDAFVRLVADAADAYRDAAVAEYATAAGALHEAELAKRERFMEALRDELTEARAKLAAATPATPAPDGAVAVTKLPRRKPATPRAPKGQNT